MNIERYANVSAVTIPFLMDELLESGAVKPGQKLFLAAFGAGLTYGSCVLEWE